MNILPHRVKVICQDCGEEVILTTGICVKRVFKRRNTK